MSAKVRESAAEIADSWILRAEVAEVGLVDASGRVATRKCGPRRASDGNLHSATAVGRFVVFGRLGLTWRSRRDLHPTAKVDACASPYVASAMSPLSAAAVMLGLGAQ